MRQFTKAIALMAVSAMTLTSCGDEALWSGPSDEGAVKLNLTSDGRVMRQTRADDSQSPVVPDVSSFGVNLAKIDGTYSKSCQCYGYTCQFDGVDPLQGGIYKII